MGEFAAQDESCTARATAQPRTQSNLPVAQDLKDAWTHASGKADSLLYGGK